MYSLPLVPNNKARAAGLKTKQTFRGVVLRDGAQRASARNLSSKVPSPGKTAVRVGREVAGRGGKGVSVIAGLPLPEAELEALATRLKKLCGAGGAVKDGSIEIQGDHRDRLVEELQKLGYEAKRSGG